jgi:FAD/FMN-containing dehydrogenase
VGFALGGGIGPSTANYGAAVDNIVSAIVCLPNGDVVEASETSNPDLFWGIRGGKIPVRTIKLKSLMGKYVPNRWFKLWDRCRAADEDL